VVRGFFALFSKVVATIDGGAASEAELRACLIEEAVLGCAPLVVEIVLAWPRVVHTFDHGWVQDGIEVHLDHSVPRLPERVPSAAITVLEGGAAFVSRKRG